MWTLISKLLAGTPTPAPARRPRRTVFRLEGLEARDVPSAVGPDSDGMADLARASKTAHSSKPSIEYADQIDVDHSSKTMKKVAKKNTLALKDLSPGNYTVSYNPRPHAGGR